MEHDIRSRPRAGLLFLLTGALALLNWSCGGAALAPGGCVTGDKRPCFCDDGRAGAQTCSSQGIYGSCRCDGAPADAGPPRCGDGICNGGEDCLSCQDDCGECPKCNYAPSCTDAVGVPTMTSGRPDLCVPVAGPPPGQDGGAEPAKNCGAAKLRMRVSKIHIKNGGGKIYCVVNASDGVASEVAITTKTSDLGDGQDFFFDPSVGVFWGQKELHPTTNNLTITYNCVVIKDDVFAKVLQAAADQAAKVGGIAGPYGWAFGLGSVGASVAAAALQASNGDNLRLNAQQTIDKSQLLDLTNGRTWTIRKSDPGGVFGIGKWDWTLTIESWGCADAKPFPM